MQIDKQTLAMSAFGVSVWLFALVACSSDSESPNFWGNTSAGSGAQSGTGGAPGSGGSGGQTGPAPVPVGCDSCGPLEQCYNEERCVAKLVEVPDAGSIDATEVTRWQYYAWVQSGPSMADQPGKGCWFNTSYTPRGGWPPTEANGKLPVDAVDYCDAYMYCKGNGKRLCGKIGGGPLSKELIDDPAVDQWYAACSKGGGNAYPYGNEPNATACSTSEAQTGVAEVGTFSECQSYPGIYDMVGNVNEWTDTCLGDDRGPRSYCWLRGGSAAWNHADATCAYRPHSDQMRGDGMDGTGFRCCAD